MDEPGLEDYTKSALAIIDWSLPKIKNFIKKMPEKKHIEVIINKLIDNNYIFSDEIEGLLKDDYGFYENSWGKVLKELAIYKKRCKNIIELCIKRGWIKINPKAKCKVKISEITKLDDAKWGFTTIRCSKNGFTKQKRIRGIDCDIYTSPSVQKGEVYIKLEETENEYILGVFKLL